MALQAQRAQRMEKEQAVARFIHMLNSHCPGNVAPLLAQDVNIQADENALGWDEVNAYLVRLWEQWPELVVSLEHMIIDESMVAAEVSYRNGPQGQGAHCLVIQLRDNLIRRVRVY